MRRRDCSHDDSQWVSSRGDRSQERVFVLPRELHCCFFRPAPAMSSARKQLVWSITKNLYRLSGKVVYELARDIAANGKGATDLESSDEESCVGYILDYMQSETLISSEDEGMSQLLMLNDLVCQLIENPDTVDISNRVTQQHEARTDIPTADTTPTHANDNTSATSATIDAAMGHSILQHIHPNTDTSTHSVDQLQVMYEELGKKLRHYQDTATTPHSRQPSSHTHLNGDIQTVISPKDLPYLQRRDFKVHGGQIGDQNSEVTYNSVCKQIDEGVREGFTEAEVIRGVLRIIKPGAFKDMLTNKDEITICELKGFLRSHLGEKASTELFQELMCAKQNEQEPPQQFVYRMIGLKQRILFQSKQANTDIRYDPKTIQEVFLHTIYQGLSSKHTDVRQQLRPLLANHQVTDEDIVSRVTKIISDENEHQRRLGYVSKSKAMHAHSAQVDDGDQPADKREHHTIQKLSAQVESLTKMVAALMDQQAAAIQTTHPKASPAKILDLPQAHPTAIPSKAPPPTPGLPSFSRKSKVPLCNNCSLHGLENCDHCFVCGASGHRAVGCSKRVRQQGNESWSLSRDNQRPFHSPRPTQ